MTTDSGTVMGPAFPQEEFETRLRHLRAEMSRRQQDAAMFFAPESIYYLCGAEYPVHFSFQCLVVPLDRQPFMICRQLFANAIRDTAWLGDGRAFPDSADPIEATRAALEEHGLGRVRIGLEETASFLTVQTMRKLRDALPDVIWGDCSGVVERLRLTKSPRELEYIRKASAISDIALKAAREIIRVGVSEAEIAAAMYEKAVLAGGEYQACPLYVGIEERSRLGVPCIPSADRKLGPGETMWIEVFGTVRRYAAGLKANFGGAPVSRDVEKRWETAQRAISRAVQAIKPGRPASVVPDAIHATFRDAGFEPTPFHQSGYSIGISFSPLVHEARLLSLRQGNDMLLQEGMTLFPIANLYGPGTAMAGSCMVIVRSSGAEVLTGFEPEPGDLSL